MHQTIPKRLILVADDNHDLARCMAFLLEFAGFRVTTVFDGPSAVAALEEAIPDIALLDIGLPGLNGFQVADKIRSVQGPKVVLIIAISGYHPDQVRANWLPVFDHHFVKPLDIDTILPLLECVG